MLTQTHTPKTDLIHLVSHELRSPLTSMALATRLLRSALEHQQVISPQATPESDPILRYLHVLQRECQHQEKLVTDLLDLQQLNADAYPVDLRQVRVQTQILDLIELFQERTFQQQQIFHVELDPDLPPCWTDMGVLRRILSELLTNACKYTPAQHWIHLMVRPADRYQIQIQITNTGVEISPEDQIRIFEPFYRGAHIETGDRPGTGLGLALVKRFVTRLQGWIGLESRANQTEFRILLPQGG